MADRVPSPHHLDPSRNPEVRVRSVEVLSDNWYTLRKVGFDHRRRDGPWAPQFREASTG
ncbi:hypothetical protein BH24ACT5_BH24ACT5_20560 [soil metagenome]